MFGARGGELLESGLALYRKLQEMSNWLTITLNISLVFTNDNIEAYQNCAEIKHLYLDWIHQLDVKL